MMNSTTPQRYRSTSTTYTPTSAEVPPQTVADSPNAGNGSLRRKGSFSFLKRSKSRERSVSGSSTPQRKLSKKESRRRREQEMMQEQIPARPPRLPMVSHPSDLQTFGGEETRPDSVAIMSNRAGGSFHHRLAQKTSQETIGSDMYRGMPIPPVPPIPPIPGTTPTSARNPYVDQFARTESMANRGRHSYASSAISTINSPRKIRRRKDPTPFNILVVGARNSGKTSFIDFLRTSLALPAWKQRNQPRDDDFNNPLSTANGAFPTFTSHYVETEVESERIGVTLWDSEGLESNVVDIQIQDLTTFIESKFEDTYNEESKVARAPGFLDTHIHCVLLVLDPVRLDANIAADRKANEINGAKAKANSFAKGHHEPILGGLDENLDLNLLRGLKGKTSVVPIIGKADTITSAHMALLKRAVWESLKKNGLETLEALSQDDEDDSDTASEKDGRDDLNERDEDGENHRNPTNGGPYSSIEEDKFSITSHLDSASDSSSFSASDFDLAKPGKPSKLVPVRTPSSPTVPPVPIEPPVLPMSIISPDLYEPDVMGRKFPWGFADPMNAEHCDFVRLKEKIFMEWRGDLRQASRELWYEGWRTSRLNKKARRNGGFVGSVGSVMTQAWAQ
ncbi:hypothetical protein P7C71_g729, partial [Lecanoromycetidae sp. Uapishka_2]